MYKEKGFRMIIEDTQYPISFIIEDNSGLCKTNFLIHMKYIFENLFLINVFTIQYIHGANTFVRLSIWALTEEFLIGCI